MKSGHCDFYVNTINQYPCIPVMFNITYKPPMLTIFTPSTTAKRFINCTKDLPRFVSHYRNIWVLVQNVSII